MFSLGVSSGLVPSYCNSYKYITCKSWHHWNSTSLVWILSHWWSNCLADISAWRKEHHLQLNLTKTELLVFPATPTLQHDFTIQLGSSTITSSSSVRNLGVIFDDQLTFKEHITKTARFCRFALHNIRKILTDPSIRSPVRRLLLKNSVYHIKTSLMGIVLS